VTVIGSIPEETNVNTTANSTSLNTSISDNFTSETKSMFQEYNISNSTITGYISKMDNYGLVTIKFSA
jgi:hypothetical protein